MCMVAVLLLSTMPLTAVHWHAAAVTFSAAGRHLAHAMQCLIQEGLPAQL
jgi:hypothetical protein